MVLNHLGCLSPLIKWRHSSSGSAGRCSQCSGHNWAKGRPLLCLSVTPPVSMYLCCNLMTKCPHKLVVLGSFLVTEVEVRWKVEVNGKFPQCVCVCVYHLRKVVGLPGRRVSSSWSLSGWRCRTRWRQKLFLSRWSPACSPHLALPCSSSLPRHR